MLRQRIVTALVLVAVLVAAVFFAPRGLTVGLLGAVLLGGAWEWAAFLGAVGGVGRWLYVLGVAATGALVWWWSASPGALTLLLATGLGFWLLGLAAVARYPFRIRPTVAALAGLLALVPAWAALGRLHVEASDGPLWLLFLFCVVWAADVGAFFVGRAIGRVKLASRVSPGKTWEGVLGGLFPVACVAWIAAWWFQMPAYVLIALSVGAAGVSIVGDLTVSMFKRNVGLKDSGSVFPGHGGILDRLDSVIGAAPAFVLGLGLLGVLQS